VTLAMPLTALITGFGPFPGAPVNPTAALAESLVRRRRPAFAAVARIAHVFPTSYAAVDRELPALIRKHRPDLVLLFGLATRTPKLRVEAGARNRRSALFADVDGVHPATTIHLRGPAMRYGKVPQQTLLMAARAARVPAQRSIDAGKYLCNYAYWRALELAAHDDGPLVQFIHVPKVRGTRRSKPGSRHKRRQPSPSDLFRAGEAILLALLAAARRNARAKPRVDAASRSSSGSTAASPRRRVAAVG
jgi:pyroglutamyl-peptidase